MQLSKREVAMGAMEQALEELCPGCGERLLGGVEVYGERGDRLNYVPCCDAGAALVADEHFFALLDHRELRALLWLALGVDSHEVVHEYEDWRLIGPIDVREIEQRLAKAFVAEHHRHHKPPIGDKFRLGAYVDGDLIGVAMAGRPVGRWRDPSRILEVTRVAILERDMRRRNVASALYGAVCAEAKKRGYHRVITYTLDSEHGTSLRAAGFQVTATVKGRSWGCQARPREDDHPLCDKLRYERFIGPAGPEASKITGTPAARCG